MRLADESVCIGPPPAAKSYLNIPVDHRRGRDHRRRGDPPGLRLPRPRTPLRRDRRGARLHLHRPQARAHPDDGRQDQRQAGGRASRHAGGARLRRRRGRPRPRRSRPPQEIGFPVLIKAAAGGGGRGMTVVRDRRRAATRPSPRPQRGRAPPSATTAVYMEKLPRPAAPHRGAGPRRQPRQRRATWASATARCSAATRRCSRRPPRPVLDAATRAEIGEVRRRRAMRELGYRSVGTIEFLYEDGEFYFIEMNTRLQVEHPVTELITGIDLVREQIRIAAGAAARLHPEGRASSRATPSSAGSTPRTRAPSCPRPAR